MSNTVHPAPSGRIPGFALAVLRALTSLLLCALIAYLAFITLAQHPAALRWLREAGLLVPLLLAGAFACVAGAVPGRRHLRALALTLVLAYGATLWQLHAEVVQFCAPAATATPQARDTLPERALDAGLNWTASLNEAAPFMVHEISSPAHIDMATGAPRDSPRRGGSRQAPLGRWRPPRIGRAGLARPGCVCLSIRRRTAASRLRLIYLRLLPGR